MSARLLIVAALLLSTPVLQGCGPFRFLAYFLSPRQMQKAEFTFPDDARVLVMVEADRPEYDNPVFNRAMFEKLVELFREKKSNVKLVSPLEVLPLRRSNEDFATWTIQRIGRELKCDHVIYLKVDKLQVQTTPDVQVLEPRFDARMKVICVDHPATEARVFPPAESDDRDGRRISVTRQADVTSDNRGIDAAAIKLGKDCAHYVIGPFFELDLEEPTPQEQ
ncbi:MAG: hypothetical protein ACKVS9_18620 [Phycisphaerae bacterium]